MYEICSSLCYLKVLYHSEIQLSHLLRLSFNNPQNKEPEENMQGSKKNNSKKEDKSGFQSTSPSTDRNEMLMDYLAQS